jgi:signal-transduction protein with cAMP-binding, CBS, and nucleotidyltransferase domain
VPAPQEILRRVSLFEGVSDRDLKHLADSLKAMAFSQGDVILSEGAGGVGFYVVGEGTSPTASAAKTSARAVPATTSGRSH